MAANRMYLVFKPTGQAIVLGKRTSFGWDTDKSTLGKRIETLFKLSEEACENNVEMRQDSFSIVLEDTSESDAFHHDFVFVSGANLTTGILQLSLFDEDTR